MMSLFSHFDVHVFTYPLLFIFMSSLILLNSVYKLVVFKSLIKFIFNELSSFFLTLKMDSFSKSNLSVFVSMFLLIMMLNFLSVFSFNFPISSQISVIMFLSFSVWLGMNIFFVIMNPKGFFSHLVPEGTPLALVVVLFLIELVSSIIRPITLTVRLVANILAGHLLMILLSSLVLLFPYSSIFYIGLNLIEMFVALIQSYIFTTMVVLYFSEV